MANKADRVVIDTNLWVSFLITKNFSKLDKILISGRTTLLFSRELLNEFLDVARRPKLKVFFSHSTLEALLSRINNYAEFIEVKSAIKICRDEKDNFLLALALDGQADYLITGDKDLTDMKEFGKSRIVSISAYLSEI